ncbi:bifunctional Vacuolar protein sorting-associated protein 35/Vacuolar protein sorting-associated protein 35 [Babesia duncani]|uniref:Vacuolar protein sorting-associated protein 35 n=1 Tax=Babesia duncani TaxID=323732 RepID=A0AAD9PL51_9APIC|nr:bifunctional Vacuolar protein sorting-associated protein 35/Vacuolar protein sorting-associated protein 35 [Babesia duncani]
MADYVAIDDSGVVIDQGKLLDEALFFVKEQAYYMRKAADEGDLSEALKFGNNVVSELRASNLSPTHYYELYMKVFNELQYLADFMGSETNKGHKIEELYQTVQQSCFILPRLYLLVMTGAHYIKIKRSAAKEILNDIIELCKGVQHPMRGLFLRYYLVQICKDKLPDLDSNDTNGIHDAFEFLMTNFKESLRLWIRLNSSCTNILDQRKKDKERLELGLLVGANLVRIAQLEGLELDFYKTTALPQILEQVKNLSDHIAQKYILDCVIQAFSDEFHLNTLSEILQVSVSCIKNTNGIGVVSNMMSRLATFITANPESIPVGVDVFEIFHSHFSPIEIGGEHGIGIRGFLELQASFLEFTATLYPAINEYVELILNNVVNVVKDHVNRGGQLDHASCKNVVILLTAPLKSLSLKCLDYSYNESLIKLLDPAMKRTIAVAMIEALINARVVIENISSLESFLVYISPLFETPSGESNQSGYEDQQDECDYEHHICRLIDAIRISTPEGQFDFYKILQEKIQNLNPLAYLKALPCLLFNCLKLLFRFTEPQGDATPIKTKSSSPKDMTIPIFQMAFEITSALQSHVPVETVKLLIMCAISANECATTHAEYFGEEKQFLQNMQRVCYDFLVNACICFEDYVSGCRNELEALRYMMSGLCKIQFLTQEHHGYFGMKLAKYGANLLKFKDKCAALEAACYVFNNSIHKDESRVLWCMQQAIDMHKATILSNRETTKEQLKRIQQVAESFNHINTENITEQIEKLQIQI